MLLAAGELLSSTLSPILALDWESVLKADKFTDGVMYFWMAASSTSMFMVRLMLSMFGGFGGGDGGDVGGDGGDASGADSADAFGLFSVLSILAFFMGTGWMGLACRIEFDLGSLPSALISAAFGFTLMSASSYAMYFLRRMGSQTVQDMGTAVGTIGKAYMTVPAKGEGLGQVEVVVSGKRQIFDAASAGARIESFQSVRVVSVRDDRSLVVEPAD